jgi:hypothetical protein
MVNYQYININKNIYEGMLRAFYFHLHTVLGNGMTSVYNTLIRVHQ